MVALPEILKRRLTIEEKFRVLNETHRTNKVFESQVSVISKA
jgi:hypothetical protein